MTTYEIVKVFLDRNKPLYISELKHILKKSKHTIEKQLNLLIKKEIIIKFKDREKDFFLYSLNINPNVKNNEAKKEYAMWLNSKISNLLFQSSKKPEER